MAKLRQSRACHGPLGCAAPLLWLQTLSWVKYYDRQQRTTPTTVWHITWAWKTFLLLPRWLLWASPASAKGPSLASTIRHRLQNFYEGRWEHLHEKSTTTTRKPHHQTVDDVVMARNRRAEALASLGELSRASSVLNSSAGIASLTDTSPLLDLHPPPLETEDLSHLNDRFTAEHSTHQPGGTRLTSVLNSSYTRSRRQPVEQGEVEAGCAQSTYKPSRKMASVRVCALLWTCWQMATSRRNFALTSAGEA